MSKQVLSEQETEEFFEVDNDPIMRRRERRTSRANFRRKVTEMVRTGNFEDDDD